MCDLSSMFHCHPARVEINSTETRTTAFLLFSVIIFKLMFPDSQEVHRSMNKSGIHPLQQMAKPQTTTMNFYGWY